MREGKGPMTNIESISKEVLHNIGDGVLVIDREYKIIFVNKAMLQLCGQRREDVIGQKCHKFSHQCPVPCHKKGISVICPHINVFKIGESVSVVTDT